MRSRFQDQNRVNDACSSFYVLRSIRILRWVVLLAVLGLIGWAAHYEMRTSYVEAWLFLNRERRQNRAGTPSMTSGVTGRDGYQ